MGEDCPFRDLGLDWDAIEEMLEVSDHDESGDTSYNELREFINAVIVLSYIPMTKECKMASPIPMIKLQSWTGVLESDISALAPSSVRSVGTPRDTAPGRNASYRTDS